VARVASSVGPWYEEDVPGAPDILRKLSQILESYGGRYETLRAASDFESYLSESSSQADEELLTEPILQDVIERILGFPKDAYFPQLQRTGLKPDFTPIDLIAHPFVLDAKTSDQELGSHERQIRRYMTQRSLDYGVLFNLKEIRVYRRGQSGHDPALSFPLLPLWKVARGEALPATEVDAFLTFCELFSYRQMSFDDKVSHIREQMPWAVRLAQGADVEVDVEFLVDRLRFISRVLAEDAAAQTDRLDSFLRLNPGRDQKLLDELRLLALDFAPGTDLAQLPSRLGDWRAEPGLPQRVWQQYLLRVSYLVLTRIMLYRAWEDVEFVDDFLYDGGFARAYERLESNVRQVLDEAFLHGAERYRWLYGSDNNYDWYRPRPAALVDVLYSFAPVPLGRLNADVLGSLYESYVDDIDRDRLGQFFTPRSVVRFMLDRAQFVGPEGVFRIEQDQRKPRRVFDFATGSGGFLVEAARRVIEDGGINPRDIRDLEDALAAIVTGFVGGEISPFPYYLTEINLLLQVSRLLGLIRIATKQSPHNFALGVLHVDSLAARHTPERSLENFDPALRPDKADLVAQEGFDLVPLDGDKRETFRLLLEDGEFDLVTGNPPYVTEANNKVLFDRLRSLSAWQDTYRGKTDYLYYFLILAVEKLAAGGRLCIITPASWMNAGNAHFLRERLANELRLDEIFLFGSYRLFAPEPSVHKRGARTPLIESAILVATKTRPRKNHKVRIVVLEDATEVVRAVRGDHSGRILERTVLLRELSRRADAKPARKSGLFVHDVPQAKFLPDRPWPLKHGAADVAARVVDCLQRLLDDERSKVEPLDKQWKVFMGIETGADSYTARIEKRLDPRTRTRLAEAGLRRGDPILQLPAEYANVEPWTSNRRFLARAPEPQGILYGAIDPNAYVWFVRIERTDSPSREVLKALEPWKPVLETRAEIARNTKRQWWETAWPRDALDLKAPKVIALHRTNRGRFALDEEGKWMPGKTAAVVVGRAVNAPVAYLCGLLNSELLDLWYAVRGRTARDVWRDYEPKPLKLIPYRDPRGDARANQIAKLVHELADNRRGLLEHRSVVKRLGPMLRDPWRAGPVDPQLRNLIEQLPASETVSVRLDPTLTVEANESPLGRLRREASQSLIFERSKHVTARIDGPEERLDLLQKLVEERDDDVFAILLPKAMDQLTEHAGRSVRAAEDLIAHGRELVESIERLVCDLYSLPSSLTDAVVRHAQERARSPESDALSANPEPDNQP
jgi:hypothetical protein